MKKLTPMKAIRAKCLDCSGDSPKEVRLCEMSECSLYSYRLGKRPKKSQVASGIGILCEKAIA